MTTNRTTHVHVQKYLEPFKDHKMTLDEIIGQLHTRLTAHQSIKPDITVRSPLAGGESNGFAISVQIITPDIDRLSEYSLQTLATAQKTPNLIQPKLKLNISNPKIHITMDRQRTTDLGIRITTVNNTLQLTVTDDDQISTYQKKQEQY